MACLKLMDGFCFLRCKGSRKSLMEKAGITVNDVDYVDETQINGLYIDYEYSNIILRLDEFVFNAGRCKDIINFLLLSKMDFEQERYIKKRLYGREFENMDCPKLVKNYLHCITLNHTFSDDFTFVDLNLDYLPCTSRHSEKRRPLNLVVSPCKLAKIRLMMMTFVHKQIGLKGVFDKDIHEQIGQHIFFHDRLIECWIRDIDLDIVSDNFSTMNSPLHVSHCKQYIKQSIFIVYDNITWKYEDGEERMVVYVYDGDYLNVTFRKQLIRMSDCLEPNHYSIRARDHHVQDHQLTVKRVSRHFSMLDSLHDPNVKFDYICSVGGVIVNRQIQRKHKAKSCKDTSYSLFSFLWLCFVNFLAIK